MANRIFAIVLDEPNTDVADRIKENYPETHKHTDTFYLVAVEGAGALSSKVATVIGIKGKDRVEESSGIVFRLRGGYSGYTYKSLWEWFASVEDED